MRTPGTKYSHITTDTTTELVTAGNNGFLHRVLVTAAGSAGTITIEDQAGNDIAVIDADAIGDWTFGLDLKTAGLQIVTASFAGDPKVTVIFEGG